MKTHYEEAGDLDSPPLVLIHGAGGSSATWFMQLKGLAKDFHVIAPDLNGHGKTPDRERGNTLSSYLQDIDSIVRQFEKPVLGGHSMGGALTQLYALAHPNRLGGIVLVSTGARLRCAPFIFHLLDNDFEGYVHAVGEYMFSDSASEELIEASQAEVRKCNPSVIKRDFAICDEFDIMNEIPRILIPALIVVGEDDVMTPLKYSEYLHDKMPNSRLVVIPGAGHSVMLEQPALLNVAIKKWYSA
ncbi:alpha/beta hydrolase [Candidatus Thorarchaeota archaeon]|nr:MAG: alpha/beta hydrolase [Candidatus Thorarchaeota archaeon]